MTKFILTLICPVLLASTGWAENCLETSAEYTNSKSSLPAEFQNLPVLLTTDSLLVTAGLKFLSVGSKLKIEGLVWKPGEIYSDENYIKKICYSQKQIQITFENNKKFNLEISNNQIKILGFNFKRSTDSQFASIIEKIQRGKQTKESNSHSTNSTNGVN